jgi:SAM-dependent methyltransferase
MPTERRLRLDDLLFAGDVRPAAPGGHFARHAGWMGSLVLDHGCGDGVLRDPVTRRGATYVGLDPYSTTCELVAPGESIPLADESVDVVVSHGVLHLVPHPSRDFAEIARVLRPGGRLLAFAAFTESFQESSTFHPSHRGLELLCSEAGLRLESIGQSALGIDYHAAEILLPMGLFAPGRRALRTIVRAGANGVLAAWSAAFAARRCLREGSWGEWNALRRRWRWYFSLALASGFELVATKPGEWSRREALPALDAIIRCPRTGEPLHAEPASFHAAPEGQAPVDQWLVAAGGAFAYPQRGRVRWLAAKDAITLR